MSFDFSGKTVAVSGAGVGFGRAIALAFAAQGANVFGCDVLEAELAQVAREGPATVAVVDLLDRAAAAAWICGIEASVGGAVDILINNAGGVAGQDPQPIEDVSDEAWDRVIAINLGAAMALCRAAAPGMKRRGAGAIVNIGSGASTSWSTTRASWCARRCSRCPRRSAGACSTSTSPAPCCAAATPCLP